MLTPVVRQAHHERDSQAPFALSVSKGIALVCPLMHTLLKMFVLAYNLAFFSEGMRYQER